MSAIAILLLTSLVLAVGFLAAFIWTVRTGQLDDVHTPSLRMLADDGDGSQGQAESPGGGTGPTASSKTH